MNEQPQPPKRRRAKGRTLGWDAAAIARESRVTAQDIEDAKQWWRDHTTGGNKRLLDATTYRESSQDG